MQSNNSDQLKDEEMKLEDLATEVKAARTGKVRYEFDDEYKLRVGSNEYSLAGQWIDLHPLQSDAYIKHRDETNRKYAGDEKKSADARFTEAFAGAIADWSFDDKLTLKNKVAMLEMFGSELVNELLIKANTVNFTKPARKL